MKQRKGNPEHIERIRSVKPVKVSKRLTNSELLSIHPTSYVISNIDDWFNRKPIKWSCTSCLSDFNLYNKPHIELSVNCGKLSFYKSIYMKDHKTKSDLICAIKKDIAFAQRVFSDYSAGLSSLLEAGDLLSEYKYPRKIIVMEDDTEISLNATFFAFVAFMSVIGILIAVGANQ